MAALNSRWPARALAVVGLMASLAVAMPRARTQQSPRDPVRGAQGTAAIAGIVRSSGDPRAPLRLARITITGGSLLSPRIGTTDDDGRFSIEELPAGQYTLSASKPAYLSMNFGATRPNRAGTSIVLADGQRVSNVEVSLPRSAAISGTVTSATGEPMPDAYVTPLQWKIFNGERRVLAGRGAYTDDRGVYRLSGLETGEYLVAVQASDFPPFGAADLIQIGDGEIDRALQAVAQPVRIGPAPAPPASVRPVGWAPMFYPGTPDVANATTLTLGAAENREGIDVRGLLAPMARLDGIVVAPGGGALPAIQVILTPLGPPVPNEAFGSRSRLGPKIPDAEGRFAFAGVPPGDYRLSALPRTPAAAGRGNPVLDADERSAFATVNVHGDDASVTLTLQAGMTMTGRVRFDGTSSLPNFAGTMVTLEDSRVDQSGVVRNARAAVEPDQTFRVTGLWPGRFLLGVTVPGSSATTGWALSSIVSGGRDLLDAPFELRPNESALDVTVTFTDHPSEIGGSLQTSSGAPTSDYFIVVFSRSPAFWFPNSRRIMSVRPNTAGLYNVRGLPAGEYFMAALTDVETGEWFDPAFLQRLAGANPLAITLRDGEKKTQDLRIGAR